MAKSDVLKLARELGARVDDDKIGHTHSCGVEAPKGYVWKASGTHEIVDAAYKPWKPDYADLLARMSLGIEECTDAECDWCFDNECCEA